MNLHWIWHFVWAGIGALLGATTITWFIVSREDERMARYRRENADLRADNARLRIRNADATAETLRLEAALEFANNAAVPEQVMPGPWVKERGE